MTVTHLFILLTCGGAEAQDDSGDDHELQKKSPERGARPGLLVNILLHRRLLNHHRAGGLVLRRGFVLRFLLGGDFMLILGAAGEDHGYSDDERKA